MRLFDRWLRLTAIVLLLVVAAGCERGSEGTSVSESNQVNILAGSELKEVEPVLQQAAQAAGVPIKLSYAGTLEIVERVNSGERFDMILPSSGAYPLLALQKKPLASEKLFYARVAIGVKAAKAQALGWGRQAPSWADIARAAGERRFTFAMTNPATSNTGMSALFAVASAAAGKTEDLTVGEVNRDMLTAFLRGQALTAGSSGWLAEAFVREAGKLDGMVNYEGLILRTNAALPADDRLTLIYPRDGVMTADYPLMLLADARRDAFTRLVAAIKSKPIQDALAGLMLRPAIPDVAPSGLSTAPVAELVFPNRLDVIDTVISASLSDWRRPSTSIFVIDMSSSMAGARDAAMRKALLALADESRAAPSDRYAGFQNREHVVMLSFSSDVRPPGWIRFDGGNAEIGRAAFRAQLATLKPGGATAIYDALNRAEELAAKERATSPDRIVSIVLLTDGESNVGTQFDDFRAAHAHARGVPARVFPILFGEANVAQMNAVAQLTGGRVFDGRTTSLDRVFKEIRGYQ